ncbi:hypothetical protein HDA32_005009 [Spinactinospora alkalitolerans]|uniref:Uncharacterized protein n=1 Tax=Spinactinospora alkalitolerans TaxID=687207 RepID=A0A852U0Z0_9ACTN|nr:hypothetical protein [Spinactinospora alkalitolerans]NYE49889.1 hypothetical protein [Spinactinospora alkalitolerans]
MKRIAAVSGLLATAALAFGAFAAPAHADNNAGAQKVTVPVCADVFQSSSIAPEGCSTLDVDSERGLGDI